MKNPTLSKREIMYFTASLLSVFLFIGGCAAINSYLGLQDDHPVEQLIEDVLEDHLDLPKDSLDLTPGD